jgi:hypothetical protein
MHIIHTVDVLSVDITLNLLLRYGELEKKKKEGKGKSEEKRRGGSKKGKREGWK